MTSQNRCIFENTQEIGHEDFGILKKRISYEITCKEVNPSLFIDNDW